MKKKKTKSGGSALVRFIDRVFGLIVAAVIVGGIFGLALEWTVPRPERLVRNDHDVDPAL